jgi:hypothetical protein
MTMAGSVPLYRFPQEVLLGVEFDLFIQSCFHGLSLSFPFLLVAE